MNEKKKQYWSLGNDKSLIDRKAPTESDLEKFYEWRSFKSKKMKTASIVIGMMLLFMACVGLVIGEAVVLVVMALFGLVEFLIIKEYKNSKKYVLEYCDYGTIIDKYEDRDRDDKDYYAIVQANNNMMKYKLTRTENELMDINDVVVVFAIQNKNETYIAKKD